MPPHLSPPVPVVGDKSRPNDEVVDPARELAAVLQAQIEMEQLNNNAFSPSEQLPLPHYESQVETYYRSLSEITASKE